MKEMNQIELMLGGLLLGLVRPLYIKEREKESSIVVSAPGPGLRYYSIYWRYTNMRQGLHAV
jgi:hypothetical protein